MRGIIRRRTPPFRRTHISSPQITKLMCMKKKNNNIIYIGFFFFFIYAARALGKLDIVRRTTETDRRFFEKKRKIVFSIGRVFDFGSTVERCTSATRPGPGFLWYRVGRRNKNTKEIT